MDIPHQRLVYFYETVHAGSLRKASARLNIAPSAVSRQIALLEEALSSRLLERTRQGIRATPVGEMLLAYCCDRTALDQNFIAAVESYRRLESGTITLAVGEGFISGLITSPLKDFVVNHEGIHLEIRLLGTSEVVTSIVEGEAHIGLMFHDRTHPMVRFWHSSRQPLMLVLPPGHALATNSRASLTLDQLAKERMAMLEADFGVRQLIETAYRELGNRTRVTVTTNSIAVLKNYVRSGLGVTLLPRFAVAQEVDDGVLAVRSIDNPILTSAEAHLITRVGRQQPLAAQRLLRQLSTWLNAFRG